MGIVGTRKRAGITRTQTIPSFLSYLRLDVANGANGYRILELETEVVLGQEGCYLSGPRPFTSSSLDKPQLSENNTTYTEKML